MDIGKRSLSLYGNQKNTKEMKLNIKANENNFFTKSTVVFTKTDKSQIKGKNPDYVSYCKLYSFDELDLTKNPNLHFIGKTSDGTFVYENKSFVSSKYWYTEEGVYRESDHWNRVASCNWSLLSSNSKPILSKKTNVGFAKWNDFVFLTSNI